MTNPLAIYRSSMFGSRGVDVGLALEYVDQLATASSDPVAVQTAARVLLNTLIGAVDQILTSRSPEKLAILELIDARIAEKAADIDQQISDRFGKVDWIDSNFDVEDQISNWMSDNFDVTDYNINDAIESWMDNSLEDRISNLDLVVRTR